MVKSLSYSFSGKSSKSSYRRNSRKNSRRNSRRNSRKRIMRGGAGSAEKSSTLPQMQKRYVDAMNLIIEPNNFNQKDLLEFAKMMAEISIAENATNRDQRTIGYLQDKLVRKINNASARTGVSLHDEPEFN